jgi:hypothetical protein
VKRCGAKTRSGTPCQQEAGWGTDHVGAGLCKLHGGSSPGGKLAAAREESVTTAMLLLGAEPTIHPHEAIMACLQSAWDQWRFCETQIAKLQVSEVSGRVMREKTAGGDAYDVVDLAGEPAWAWWVVARDKARDQAAKYAEMAARMGVAERQIQMAETLGRDLGGLLRRTLERLGVSEEMLALVPGALRAELEGSVVK